VRFILNICRSVSKYKNRIKWLEDKLSQLEKIKCFTDIDGKTTEVEINSAINEMKYFEKHFP
jgi:cell fate (sporulation/competence/biofilm development) regulator YmcA (YheA/YmcA/DUF963 family)